MTSEWDSTKASARALLLDVAAARSTITYEELAARLAPLSFAPDDPALGRLLGEVSAGEEDAGRGMLSVVVVRKGSGRPGSGFFALAARLGRDVTDRTMFWQAERDRVYREAENRTGQAGPGVPSKNP